MTKIGIITYQDGIRKGMQDYYPIIKWRQNLKKAGFLFDFVSDHKDDKLLSKDMVIIDHRYIRYLTVVTNKFEENNFILDILHKLRMRGVKLLLFDYSADSGCRYFDLIEYVDLIVKRQILNDKSLYIKKPIESQKIFVWSYGLTDDERKEAHSTFEQYRTCPKDQLHKLKVGWNIGLADYRSFPFQKYYPLSTERLLNRLYKGPQFIKPEETNRDIDSSFRGQIKDGDIKFSYQRNKLIDFLQNYNGDKNFVTGSKVSKQTYLDELTRSKTCISPYGWGEVCYRDFEAIINGSILIKPDMSHLRTWPNIYIKNETYIPLQWDMTDLESTLNKTISNYGDYKANVYKAQSIYQKHYLSADKFINQFKKLVE